MNDSARAERRNQVCKSLGLAFALVSLLSTTSSFAQSAAFTYQGRLTEAGNAANGTYDMQFKLFDDASFSTGAQQGGTIANSAVPVASGVFTVTLDFGTAVFNGSPRFIEVGVRTNSSASPYNLLAPRQPVSPTPYAIYSLTAETAKTSTTVANGAAVTSLNTLKDNVTLAAGANVTITPSGNTLTIASTVGGGGSSSLWSLAGTDAYYKAGKVGIGTMEPLTPLEVNGILRSTRSGVAPQFIQLNGGDSGSIKLTAQSTLAAEKDLFIQNLSGEATPGPNNNIRFELGTTAAPSTRMTLTRDGNLGIGTVSPQNKLHVYDPAVSVSQRIETGGGINAWAQTEYANADGLWKVGTSRGFNGDQLYFARQGAAGIAFGLQPNGDAFLKGKLNVNDGMAVTGGKVGIGTTFPLGKLHVEDSEANSAAVFVRAKGAGAAGLAVGSESGNAIFADGNAVQPPDKGGFVKAMAYIDPFLPAAQYVVHCYNSQKVGNAASTAPCGITVTRTGVGSYSIDFGFNVEDRFISLTARENGFLIGSIFQVSGNTVQVGFRLHLQTGFDQTDTRFYILVY